MVVHLMAYLHCSILREQRNKKTASPKKNNTLCLHLSCVPGRSGVAITLVTQYDIHLVHAIEEQISKLGKRRLAVRGEPWNIRITDLIPICQLGGGVSGQDKKPNL